MNEIAHYCGYSTYHFIKLFAKHTGLTPFKYVRRRRLNEVTAMKAAGMTFYDAAAKFNTSASALARAFKEEYNCTLSAYLNNEVEIELQKRIKVEDINVNWSNSIKDVSWTDKQKNSKYYCHSYPAALYSVIKRTDNNVSLEDILGFSGFAFRIDMHQNLCPSATSVFDWHGDLGFAVKNAGYKYTRIERLWDKYNPRDEIRKQSIAIIKLALQNNQIPICWDLIIPEWSLIVGYCSDTDSFLCMGPNGIKSSLKTKLLGQREIEILDVTILESANDSGIKKRFRAAIEWAVNHGYGKLWANRPAYEQGLKAWNMWQNAIDNFCNIESENKFFACNYHANIVGSARLAAADFVCKHGDESLQEAAMAYRKVAEICFGIADLFVADNPSITNILGVCNLLTQAKEHERVALNNLENYLTGK